MQLLDITAGSSCHGNTNMQCLLLCFVSSWFVNELGENARSMKGWKTAWWPIAEVIGKVFDWGCNPWRVGQFFLWKLLWWECPFACCFGCKGKIKTLTTGHLYGKISPCTQWHVRIHTFFSFITLTQVKIVPLELGCGTAADNQSEIFSFLHKQEWQNLALWPLFVKLDSWSQRQWLSLSFQCDFWGCRNRI